MVISEIDKLRIEYTTLLEREKKAEAWLNDPIRADEEVIKWSPEYRKLLDRLDDLLAEIRHYTPDNIRFGWPEKLNPFYQSDSVKEKLKEQKKEELNAMPLF